MTAPNHPEVDVYISLLCALNGTNARQQVTNLLERGVSYAEAIRIIRAASESAAPPTRLEPLTKGVTLGHRSG